MTAAKRVRLVLSVEITADTDRDPQEWGDSVVRVLRDDIEMDHFGGKAEVIVTLLDWMEP